MLVRYMHAHLDRRCFRMNSLARICSHPRYFGNTTLLSVPVQLAYASYESMKGSAENKRYPVMIMHGLFGSKNNWNSLAKAIHQRTERKVISVDARNHGDSPHSSEMSYKHMAEDVVKLLNDLGFYKAVLLGHSMGGSAMMYVALHYPDLVEKLVVVDMSPVGMSPSLAGMIKIFEAMRSVRLDGDMSMSKARKVADQQLAGTIQPAPLRQFLMTNLVEVKPGTFKWRVNLPVLEETFATRIARFPDVEDRQFNGPTIFIGGGKSDYIKPQDHEAIKKLFPSAIFRYIDDANHWVHADKPAEFLDVVTSFINEDQ